MKKIIFSLFLLGTTLGLRAEDGHQLWLRPHPAAAVTVVSTAKNSALLATAKQELARNWQGAAGATVTLTLAKDKAIKHDGFRMGPNSVRATTEAGLLYGVFELLRRQQTGQPVADKVFNPPSITGDENFTARYVFTPYGRSTSATALVRPR